MSNVLNPVPLSKIRAIREMEKSGNIKEQLNYIAALIESNSNSTDNSILELTSALASMMELMEQTTIELTTLIATVGGGLDV